MYRFSTAAGIKEVIYPDPTTVGSTRSKTRHPQIADYLMVESQSQPASDPRPNEETMQGKATSPNVLLYEKEKLNPVTSDGNESQKTQKTRPVEGGMRTAVVHKAKQCVQSVGPEPVATLRGGGKEGSSHGSMEKTPGGARAR